MNRPKKAIKKQYLLRSKCKDNPEYQAQWEASEVVMAQVGQQIAVDGEQLQQLMQGIHQAIAAVRDEQQNTGQAINGLNNDMNHLRAFSDNAEDRLNHIHDNQRVNATTFLPPPPLPPI